MGALPLLMALLVGAAPDPVVPTPVAPAPAPSPSPAPDAGLAIPAAPAVDLTVRVVPKATLDPAGTAAPSAGPATPDGRPLEVKLGEPLVLEITAIAERDTVLFPPMLPAVGTFELGPVLPGREEVNGPQKRVTWRWTIVPVRMGIEKVPGIEIPYRTPSNVEGSVKTAPVRVMIRGFLENEADPALGKAPLPVDVITTNWALVWALSVGGALVFAALATWIILLALRSRFDKLRPAPPPRPAIEVAIERLDAIDRASGAELDGALRLARTIDALREYLSGRYSIDALEMTSRELIATLPSLDLKTVAPREIEALLDDADLVKFARLMPAEDDARQKSPVVRKIVTDTWEPPKREETEEVVRLEAASSRQRVMAGVIDGFLAGALGLLLMGFLWVTGHIELGFLALILIGLLLAFRDALGASPGKKLLRLRVAMRDVRQTTPPLDLRVRRNLLFLFWPLTLPLEWLVLRQHPLTLRLGDMWADTEVVRAPEAVR